MELIIAVSLLGVLILAFTSIDTFSRYHVIGSDRRAKVQNELSYALAHMTKQISRAIGDATQTTVDITAQISSDPAIRVWIDGNANGRRETYPSDYEIAYRYCNSGNDRYQIWYYSVCVGPNCNQPGSTNPEVIVRNISSPPTYSITGNYVEVELIGRWRASEAKSVDNPELTMRSRVYMPAVSTH
jgi:hypothetical protein